MCCQSNDSFLLQFSWGFPGRLIGNCDAPMVTKEGKQTSHPIQPREVQQILVAIGEIQGDAGLILMNWANKSGHLVTLVT